MIAALCVIFLLSGAAALVFETLWFRQAGLALGHTVWASALVTASSGDLVRVEGRLSKSPSFWVRWVNISSTYAPMAGTMMPVSVESTADVRIAGMSTFSMTYDYQTVAGQAVNGTPRFMAAR